MELESDNDLTTLTNELNELANDLNDVEITYKIVQQLLASCVFGLFLS